jgi:site-specific DNA recombinase
MAFDGYIRVSRVAGREGERFISPDVQREQVAAWARLRRARIDEWHSDLDVSGAQASRPGLDAAIARVERKHSEGIVVAKLDRLARSLPVAFDAISRIEAAGGVLVSVEEGVDPRTVTGRMQRNLLLMVADWYRDQIRESWAIARERAVRRGAAITSTIPTGYRRAAGGRLEPDPHWGPVVREVFERRARGAAWVELARFMNDRGVPVQYASGDKRNEGRWTGHTVSRLVAGRVYVGEVRHGEFVNAAAHEPLVPTATWHAAQGARSVLPPATNRDPALLAGLVRCSGCGYGMYRSLGRGPAGTKIKSYRCRGGGSAGVCPARAFAPADPLEGLVEREFMSHAETLAVKAAAETADLDTALAELSEAEQALRVFRDDPRIIATLGADGFAEGLRERARRVEAAQADVARERMPAAGVPDVLTLRRMWPDLDIVGRCRLLSATIDCVVVAGRGEITADRVRVCWSGLGPADLPQRGKRGATLRPIDIQRLPSNTRVRLTSQVGENG